MRIEELYLDGFGHFHQRTVGPVEPSITVFCGPNEAGKSTLLAFIRAILLGFPQRFNAHYPPLAGGRHGGRITLCGDDGTRYAVERFAGARGGLSISGPSGPLSNAESVMRQLTGNATPDLFKNVFAFSLDELQAASSLNDSSGTIYSAGQGAPGLPALAKALSDGRSSIYLPRGTNQEVPRLINALRDVEGQLRAIEGNAGRYGELTSRKAEIDSELPLSESEIACINSRRIEIERLVSGWEDWVELSGCESRLGEMPEFNDFPEDPIPRLESLQEQIEQARESRQEAADRLQKAAEAAGVELPREDLLFDREAIETIRRSRIGFDDSVKDLPERKAELNALESAFQDRLRDLGQDWDEPRLQTFDTSIAFRQEVETGKAALTQSQDTGRRAEQRLEQEQRLLAGCETAAHEAQERLPADPPLLDGAGLSRQRAAVRAARQRLNDYERARQNHENLRGQLNSLSAVQEPASPQWLTSIWLPAFFSAVGIFLIAAGIFVASPVLAIIGGVTLAGTVVWLFVRKRTAPVATPNPLTASLARQSADAESSAQSAYQYLIESASPLSIDGDPTASAFDNAEEHLDAAQAELAAWDGSNRQVQETQRRLESQQREVEFASQQLETAVNATAAAQQEWRSWLERQGLPTGFTPDTVVEFIGQVETGRARLEQVNDNRRRVAAIEKDIQEFREQVEPLAGRHGLTLDPEDSRQLASVADELIARLDEVQTAFTDRERAKEQLEQDREALANRNRRLETAEQALSALLAAGGTEDAEDFRRRARQHEERLELERRMDEHRRSLERLSGPGERLQAFREQLAKAEPTVLNEESAQLGKRIEEVESHRNVLREERGRIDAELERLSGEEESSALRIRRNVLEEQLREHAREWSRLTIAEALLEKTRHKFEQERQPSVIRYARDFFESVTGGRYGRVYAPIGEQSITVTDSTGASKRPEEMSRGTREQLYLALRFGLIREFGEHAERLPVVVDEALVNFDPERARLAAEAFGQLSETNQVLVFTCHPGTADIFAEAAGAQVVDISG